MSSIFLNTQCTQTSKFEKYLPCTIGLIEIKSFIFVNSISPLGASKLIPFRSVPFRQVPIAKRCKTNLNKIRWTKQSLIKIQRIT